MTSDPAPSSPAPRPRGRPRRAPDQAEARSRLIRAGLVQLTERGYSATGIDEILRLSGVPKGSFYHYFPTKEAFGLELVEAYHRYFAGLIDAALLDDGRPPLDRLRAFTVTAEAGMARHDFRRGCLIGNLGQEMGALPESFRARLIAVLEDWQARTARCLDAAAAEGRLRPGAQPDKLAALFWTGWEGAVLRAKLERGPGPLRLFADQFFTQITREETRP